MPCRAAAARRGPDVGPAEGAASPASTKTAADLPYREEPLTRTRRVIADRLLFSVTRKPHATHFDELNADGLVRWVQKRRREQESSGPRISFLPVLLKMIAVTLRNHPAFKPGLLKEWEERFYFHWELNWHYPWFKDARECVRITKVSQLSSSFNVLLMIHS